MTNTMSGLIFFLVGLLAIIGSALNWRIVTRSGKLLNLLLGDTVARTIYIVAGFFLLALGIGQIFGMNWLGQ